MAAAADPHVGTHVRHYSLNGPDTARARAIGLTNAEWYRTDVPRKVMKELMQRSDGPAIRDTVIWIALLIASAAGGIAFWGTWWCVPFWIVYGVLYGSSSDSRWHECGHGTAFKTTWMNDAVYQIASFMVVRNPVTWRWSHARHHTDTFIVGRDPEISCQKPQNFFRLIMSYAGVLDTIDSIRALIRNAMGGLSADERDYIPESEWPKAIRAARIHMAIYLAAVIAAVATWSFIPLMLIGLPRIYGCWHMLLTGVIQHCGMKDNVVDHRLNTRSVDMNPISRWLYWNMNYHIEHHMFPMVPYHALPRLHEVIKHDLPAPCTSIYDAYREAIPAVIRQVKDPEYAIRKPLPPTAKPYLEPEYV